MNIHTNYTTTSDLTKLCRCGGKITNEN